MKIAELQSIFLNELSILMKEYRYIKKDRSYRKVVEDIRWSLHITCINHINDFDAIGDISIEILKDRKQICIIGAELGNIEGSGQKRFNVSSPPNAKDAARNLYSLFEDIGLPFLNRFSDPTLILQTLKTNTPETQLISPIIGSRTKHIRLLESYIETQV